VPSGPCGVHRSAQFAAIVSGLHDTYTSRRNRVYGVYGFGGFGGLAVWRFGGLESSGGMGVWGLGFRVKGLGFRV
jgi:hypothetical protein